ncbi:MAG: hypothetical protein DRP09_10275 [Candidatus Thorarchaeota archaeon]|nr:MAG: hypothetical protein DRP09_10275 [Candidatus Thorarchaeota archaeon]
MDDTYVVTLTKDSFILNDGRVFDFPFDIEELPSLEEFNEMYQGCKDVVNDEDKLKELLGGDYIE